MAPFGGGCEVAGVEVYGWTFRQHDRRYTAVVAVALPLSEERRAQLEQVWASLDLLAVPQPPTTGAVIGQDYFHVLSTHCGVMFAQFDGQEWKANPRLDVGIGNPPPGWGNPLTPGTMVRLSPDRARFTVRHADLTADFRIRLGGWCRTTSTPERSTDARGRPAVSCIAAAHPPQAGQFDTRRLADDAPDYCA